MIQGVYGQNGQIALKIFLLEKNVTKTKQGKDFLVEFLRFISAEDAAENLEIKWHIIRKWHDTVLTDISNLIGLASYLILRLASHSAPSLPLLALYRREAHHRQDKRI